MRLVSTYGSVSCRCRGLALWKSAHTAVRATSVSTGALDHVRSGVIRAIPNHDSLCKDEPEAIRAIMKHDSLCKVAPLLFPPGDDVQHARSRCPSSSLLPLSSAFVSLSATPSSMHLHLLSSLRAVCARIELWRNPAHQEKREGM